MEKFMKCGSLGLAAATKTEHKKRSEENSVSQSVDLDDSKNLDEERSVDSRGRAGGTGGS